ncbi:MAG: hypothetical protein JKY89_01590 [Immundisolibacteraceae bacterium]|nr:hypothetical protein [Immundisolibacteraceae bacterium]
MTPAINQSPLLLTLKDALEQAVNQPVRIQLDRHHFLILLPPGQVVYANTTPLNLIRALEKLPTHGAVRYWALTDREKTLAFEEAGDGFEINIDALKWKATEVMAAGKTPPGLDLHADRVYIRSWPNFSRLPHSDDELRIAALWLTHPMSLIATATSLQITLEKVNSFYAAADAAGLLGVLFRETDSGEHKVIQLPETTNPTNSFIDKIKSLFGLRPTFARR